jgi:hypothetical protein
MDDINEFCDIIKLLDDKDLSILHQLLVRESSHNEVEQKAYLRDNRSTKFDGTLYNAYCARTLVIDPINYVTNEIVLRFKL